MGSQNRQPLETLVEITLPKDANIHAREYQLYLPSKEELQQKLQEWAGDMGDADMPGDDGAAQ